MKLPTVNDRSYGLLLAAPATVVLSLIVVFPLLYSLCLSFVRLNLLEPKIPLRFAGFANYLSVLTDPRFLQALLHTILFVLTTMTVEFVLGLGIAFLLNRRGMRGVGTLRTLLIVPLMVAPIVSGLQWRWIFSDQYGIFNRLLSFVHLRGPVWFASPVTAMTAIVVANLWVATPFDLLVLLAGLQGLPEEPIESAIVDGAGWFKRLWYVVLPLLRPAILAVLLIRLADAVRIFDIVYVLTGGGPGDSTQVFSSYIFTVSFNNLDLSRGAAGSFIMVLITAVSSLIMVRRFR